MNTPDRKRASMFGAPEPETPLAAPEKAAESRKLDLARFTPKRPPKADKAALKRVGAEEGFTTSHAPPPVSDTPKRDGRRLKKSNRTAQFNVRLQPDTVDRFWAAVETEGLTYADDFLRQLLDQYEAGQGG